MKGVVRVFLAVVLVLSQGAGMDLTAAGRAKKKPAADASPPTVTVPNPVTELQKIAVEENRVKIFLNQPAPYKTYLLQNPSKLVIELNAVINKAPAIQETKEELFDRVRINQYGAGSTLVTRVILDLLQPIDYET